MKRIIFNLKKVWYDKIASGEKTVEYRRICKHWSSRLSCDLFRFTSNPDPKDRLNKDCAIWPNGSMEAVFRLGYSRKYPDIVRRIEKIDIGSCPYEGWDGEYFRIYF